MRILVVSNLYPPYEHGGMELRCKETISHLTQRGHCCHVLTSRQGIRGQGIPEKGITRALHLQADIDYYRPLDFFLRRPWQEHANRQALRDTVITFEPDIIYIWGMWNVSQQVAYWAEQWMPGRVAYAVAGYWPIELDLHESYWQKPARRPWARALMAPARWLAMRVLSREKDDYPLEFRHVACVSKFVLRKLDEAGALPHGARVIYNGIDPEPFLQAGAGRKSDDDKLRLVYAGGLAQHKGVLTAIDAVDRLERERSAQGLHLTIVGGGHPAYEAALEDRLRDSQINDRVTLHGRVPREEIPSILGKHDVFLFTSVYEEPIARSVMEAMAAGLAVVATPVGGQQEMLEDGENALVFAPEDVGALAACILRLRAHPDLRARLARGGRETILSRFTLDRMVDEMEAWLEEIAA